jgi:WD40 repeat protein
MQVRVLGQIEAEDGYGLALGGLPAQGAAGIRFHPSGDRLLVSSRTGRSQLWDTETWALRGDETLAGYDIALGYWSPDGSLLATAASDGQITIRDGETFEPIRQLVGATGTFNNWAGGPLLFSEDSAFLLTDHDNVARLWDVATGQQIGVDMSTAD